MEGEGDEPTPQPTPAQMSEMWRERYGDMVPEKILDTKIGPDGRRYYKVQWAATTMERGNNFLEAELLIKKYWDPVQKKLVLPSMRTNENENNDGASSSMQCKYNDNNDGEETNKINIESQSCEREEASEASEFENTSEFIAADVTDERTEKFNTDDINNKSDCSNNTENNAEESLQTNEEREEEEHSSKRKRSDLNEIGKKDEESEIEIATKRTKDNNGYLVEDTEKS